MENINSYNKEEVAVITKNNQDCNLTNISIIRLCRDELKDHYNGRPAIILQIGANNKLKVIVGTTKFKGWLNFTLNINGIETYFYLKNIIWVDAEDNKGLWNANREENTKQYLTFQEADELLTKVCNFNNRLTWNQLFKTKWWLQYPTSKIYNPNYLEYLEKWMSWSNSQKNNIIENQDFSKSAGMLINVTYYNPSATFDNKIETQKVSKKLKLS